MVQWLQPSTANSLTLLTRPRHHRGPRRPNAKASLAPRVGRRVLKRRRKARSGGLRTRVTEEGVGGREEPWPQREGERGEGASVSGIVMRSSGEPSTSVMRGLVPRTHPQGVFVEGKRTWVASDPKSGHDWEGEWAGDTPDRHARGSYCVLPAPHARPRSRSGDRPAQKYPLRRKEGVGGRTSPSMTGQYINPPNSKAGRTQTPNHPNSPTPNPNPTPTPNPHPLQPYFPPTPTTRTRGQPSRNKS